MEYINKHNDLVYVNFTEEEVDEIYNYIDLESMDLEVFENGNCLTLDQLDIFLDRLTYLPYHSKASYKLYEELEELLSLLTK